MCLVSSSVKGAPLASNDIFEEVPIRIHNTPMSRALLLEMQEKKVATPLDFNRLDLTTSSFLEKKMQFLIEQVEDLAEWQAYASRWERKLSQQRQQQRQWLEKRVGACSWAWWRRSREVCVRSVDCTQCSCVH